jgi:hypothetical protein
MNRTPSAGEPPFLLISANQIMPTSPFANQQHLTKVANNFIGHRWQLAAFSNSHYRSLTQPIGHRLSKHPPPVEKTIARLGSRVIGRQIASQNQTVGFTDNTAMLDSHRELQYL